MFTPKGKLIPIGGSENKDFHESGDCRKSFYSTGILKRLISEMHGAESRIELVPTASGIPEEVVQRYIRAFDKLGCYNVGVMPIQNREDALSQDYIDRLNCSDGVFFTGGNQSRLGKFFNDTPFAQTLFERYMNDDFVIAGTSAGAMAMGHTMITGGTATSFKRGDVETATGLSFIDNVIVDTHFIERGRFGRLTQTVAANPVCIGIGLGEDTGLIISNGSDMEVIGSGQVIIFDGHAMKHEKGTDVSLNISIKDMAVHVLKMKDTYILKERDYGPKRAAMAS
ncbi:MAG: cyanophycinase [Balneolales bacterium]